MAWTLGLLATGVAVGGTVAYVASASLAPVEARAQLLADRIIPASVALRDTAHAADAAQAAFLQAASATAPLERAAAIDQAQQAGQQADAAWSRYLASSGRLRAERRMQRQREAANEASRSAGATAFGLSSADPAFGAALAVEKDAWARSQSIIAELEHRFADTAARSTARNVASELTDARRTGLLAAGFALFVFLGVGIVIVRRAVRFERTSARRARMEAITVRHGDIETRLQRGLEMEASEEGAYAVTVQAFGLVAPDTAVELLVADSSRAHFAMVASTDDGGRWACRVGAPSECPAASAGQTLEFSDSRALDTCPYLRDRPEPVWATCVPVNIAGRPSGVIHAQDSTEVPPPELLATELELVARKAGDRIGVLRVLARSEAQAQVDPLTGLPNRRTLEQRAHEVLAAETPFVIAFADLDHFKDLNDLHGHETGDRALRVFARVLRDSVRPRDIPARYGGEEFVVVLPDCSIVEARIAAERIRTQLAATLKGGSVPGFTVSVGLAEAEPGEALSEVIDRADAALLKAKRLGRDRVLAAGEILDTDAAGAVIDAPDATTPLTSATTSRLGT